MDSKQAVTYVGNKARGYVQTKAKELALPVALGGVATVATTAAVINGYFGSEDVVAMTGLVCGVLPTAASAVGYGAYRLWSSRVAMPSAEDAPVWTDRLLATRPYHILLGYAGKQVFRVDVRDFPHVLVSGMTRQGKTRKVLRPAIVSAALAGFQVIVLDRSGKDFYPFYSNPNIHVVKFDDLSLQGMVSSIYAEVLNRQKLLEELQVSTIDRVSPSKRPPAVLVVMDELANVMSALADGTKEMKDMAGQINGDLIRIVQEGASVNINVFAVAQRPSHDQLSTTFRSQTLPISLRLRNGKENAIVDVVDAHLLVPGQFVVGHPDYDGKFFDTWHPTDEELVAALALKPMPTLTPPAWLVGWKSRGDRGGDRGGDRPQSAPVMSPVMTPSFAFSSPDDRTPELVTRDSGDGALIERLVSLVTERIQNSQPAVSETVPPTLADRVEVLLADTRPSCITGVMVGQYLVIVLCRLFNVSKNKTIELAWQGDKSGSRLQRLDEVMTHFETMAIARLEVVR